ncbi:DUF2934 domain-containing protein [Devosia sp. J2-20]|jgi:hypothetical protein|uniref:DUF2934 domain-containing protein n=1 Tax=Devosia litorisediminis TaxID=2829817 RepID=A0A942E8I3_9HYPH|nr:MULTISPECIES: DUF2934 domain-containing protein [Devosia]MBS3847320.1 DUF2934 domain-containing protein [Devosia litorisediminis]WDQ99550.1 DUF2934 domain-containing protein [Devosia sp. J2-20]
MHKNSEIAEAIRLTAYFLWEQDGCPPGRAFEYWLRAKAQHQRQLDYDRWLAQGAPDDDVDRSDQT